MDTSVDIAYIFNMEQIDAILMTVGPIGTQTAKGNVLSRVLEYTMRGWPAKVDETLKQYHIKQTVEWECLYWGHCVVIPKSLHQLHLYLYRL
jgi:hypothetical protein